MAGTRLQRHNTPVVNRLPSWSVENFYDEGRLLWAKHFDSELIDVYVCIKSHVPNDSDRVMFFQDSEETPVLNETYWWHWVSDRVLDSEEFSFASLNRKVRSYSRKIDSDIIQVDPRYVWLLNTVPTLPDSDSVDSDLLDANIRLDIMENKHITQFFDSDARHKNIVVWDSETQKYVSRVVVRSFNGFKPDPDANIPLSLVNILSGTRDDIPASTINGSIFVFSGDSDVNTTGDSFLFDSDHWRPIISPERESLDQKFLMVSGERPMRGPLLVNIPTSPMQIASKKYVDAFVKTVKQDTFQFFENETQINITLDSENFVVVKDQPSLHFYDKINTSMVGDLNDVQVNFKDVTVVTPNLLRVETNYFSRQLDGVFQLKKNGNPEPFVSDSDDNFAFGNKLVDQANQYFLLNLTNAFDVSQAYEMTYTQHDGDVARITKEAGVSNWVVEGDNYDFGIY